MPIISLILSLFSGESKGTALRVGGFILIAIALLFIFQCNLINQGSSFNSASHAITQTRKESIQLVSQTIETGIAEQAKAEEVKLPTEDMAKLKQEFEGEFKEEGK